MTEQENAQPDMKLEVVVLGVSDVDPLRPFTRISAGGSTSTSQWAKTSAPWAENEKGPYRANSRGL
jgi:hypothetical protein